MEALSFTPKPFTLFSTVLHSLTAGIVVALAARVGRSGEAGLLAGFVYGFNPLVGSMLVLVPSQPATLAVGLLSLALLAAASSWEAPAGGSAAYFSGGFGSALRATVGPWVAPALALAACFTSPVAIPFTGVFIALPLLRARVDRDQTMHAAAVFGAVGAAGLAVLLVGGWESGSSSLGKSLGDLVELILPVVHPALDEWPAGAARAGLAVLLGALAVVALLQRTRPDLALAGAVLVTGLISTWLMVWWGGERAAGLISLGWALLVAGGYGLGVRGEGRELRWILRGAAVTFVVVLALECRRRLG